MSPQQSRRNVNNGEQPKVGNTRTGRKMLIVLLVLALCITAFLVALYPMVMIGAPREANIKIPQHATEEMVRDSLIKYFGEQYADAVINLSNLRGADFSERYGAYTVSKGDNAITAMRRLTSGGQTPVMLTINGFRSMPLLIDRISRKTSFPADSLRVALNDTALLAEYGLTPENAMALFIDDTYEIYWTITPRDLIRKIGENYKFLWNAENKAKAEQLGLEPAEAMTIASIVDEETNYKPEKGTVGRLYINRLRNNMRLQSDPTVRFAIGDYTIQRITKNDLKVESPYNTYRYNGLPPGPIRTTSIATVKEILNAKPNNYIYMCAKEDFSGTHNFTADYNQHLENAARYQTALDQRGIKR